MASQTTKTIHALESEFPELATISKIVSAPPLGTVNFRRWREVLCAATDIVDIEKDSNKAMQLLPFWLDYLEDRAIKPRIPSQIGKALDAFLHMILKHDLVEHLNVVEKQGHLLAWACLSRVEVSVHDTAQADTDVAARVINRWLTLTAKQTAQALSIESTVTLLYGPGVWDLYNGDVESGRTLAGYLYSLGLPLRINYVNQNNVSLADEIPADLV